MRFASTAKQAISLCILMSILGTYVISSLIYSIETSLSVNDALLSPLDNVNFYFNGNTEIHLVLWAAPLILLLLMFSWQRHRIIVKKYKDASDFGVHGSATWGEPKDVMNDELFVKKAGFKNNRNNKDNLPPGIILAKVAKSKELIIMPPELDSINRNIFVVGGSGSGKSQALVISNIINNKDTNMIVTDPKGELHLLTSKLKEDQGYNVVQVDFSNFQKANYNPLDYVEDDESAREVANTIASNASEDGKQDFWAKAGLNYLVGFILYAKEEYGDQATLSKVIELVAEAGRDEDYFPNMLESMSPSHKAYHAFQLASGDEDKARSSIFTTLTQQINIFSMRKVQSMTASSDFRFESLVKEKTIFYVKLRMQKNPFKQLTATFFDQLLNTLYSEADKHNGVLPIPTMFIMDEFPNIGRIDQYPEVCATCRGLNMSMITIVQSISQLQDKKLYGKENTNAMLNNHDTHLFLGSKDPETTKFYSQDMIGDTTAEYKQKSKNPDSAILSTKNTTSTSDQFTKRPLITPQELINKPKNEALLIVTGQNPFWVEKAFQFHIFNDLIPKAEDVEVEETEEIENTQDEELEETEEANEPLLTPEEVESLLEDELDEEQENEGEVIENFFRESEEDSNDEVASLEDEEAEIEQDMEELDEMMKELNNEEQETKEERLPM